MKRVLFVCSEKDEKGPSPLIRSQADSLIKKGQDIKFFLIRKKGISGYLNAVISLRKTLREGDYDIIHAHYGLCGIVGLLAKRKEKLVVSFMGDDIVGTNKHDGSVTFISRIIAEVNILFSRYFYDHSIVKSKEMMGKLRSCYNVSLIPNGVDITKFRPVERSEALSHTGFMTDKRHIIFVSDPSRAEKNFKLAEAAVKSIKDPLVVLHIVNNVTPGSLVYNYNAADLLLLTSYHEGSPNVVKEAMACNCPAVSTRVGDVEWLFGNTNGYYLAGNTISEVAIGIEHAIRFREKSNETRGRERILELGLDSGKIADKLLDLYNHLIGS